MKDVTALLTGLLLLGLAAFALWAGFGHQPTWPWLRNAFPVGLVVIGVLGLLNLRHKNNNH